MEHIFHSLGDIALRRVYKFVLKQTIGKYLKDDLLLDQLQVKTREGVIEIHDLALDSDQLNLTLESSPFTITSASVNLIEAYLSYSKLLTESCRFVVDRITVNLEAKVKDSNVSSNCLFPPDCDTGQHISENDRIGSEASVTISEEAEEGLTFIAQWIEIVVAKLRMDIRHIDFQFSSSKARSLMLQLSDLSFCNSDPSIMSNSSSLDASRNVMNSVDLAQSLLSSSKLLTIGNIQIRWINNEGYHDKIILATNGETRIRLRPDTKDGSVTFNNIDTDINLASININLCRDSMSHVLEMISDVIVLMKPINENLDGLNISGIFSHYQDFGGLSTDMEDMFGRSLFLAHQRLQQQRSVQMINHSHKSRPSPLASSLLDPEAIDSDGEFPEDLSDSDVSESEFYDALDQKPIKVMKASAGAPMERVATDLNRSKFGSSVFTSAITGLPNNELLSQEASINVRLRMSLPSVSISIIDIHNNSELSVKFEDIIAIVQSVYYSNDQSSLTTKGSIRDISIFEGKLNEEKKVLLSFDRSHDSRSIFCLPVVSFEHSFMSNANTSSIQVKIQPFALSFDIMMISNWVEFFENFHLPQFKNAPSTCALKTAVTLVSAVVVIRSDPKILSSQWNEIFDAIRLDINSANWQEVKLLNNKILHQHLNQSFGGLCFTLHDVGIEVESGKEGPRLTMESALFDIYLRVSPKLYRSNILRAYSSNDGLTKLEIKFGLPPSAMDRSSSNFKYDRGLIEDLGPQEPPVDPSKVIQVSTYELFMDIQQREYNALINISDFLVYADGNLSHRSQQSPASSENSFGVHIDTKRAFLVLGENEFCWWKTPPSAFANNDIFAALCNLCEKLLEGQEKHILNKSLKLCVAIQDPAIKIVQSNKTIFVELKANDLSIFEMGPTQYHKLKHDQFDFFSAPRTNSRMGDEINKTPVIHRAYARNHSTSDGNVQHHGQLANHGKFGSAFEVRLLLTETASISCSADIMKCLHFFIDFYDIIINYDPRATWLMKLVKVLTPLTVTQSRFINIAELLHFIEKYSIKDSLMELDRELIVRARTFLANNLLLNPPSNGIEQSALLIPFEMTKVSARVRSSLIDYYSAVSNTSLLLSADVIALSSTIVSNTDKFCLKISLSNLAFFLCNKAFHVGIEKNSLNWKDRQGYLELLSIDRLTTVVTVSNKEEQDVALEFIFGSCTVQGCLDSLGLIGRNMQEWFRGFEEACLDVDNIRAFPNTNSTKDNENSASIEHIDKLRICTEEEDDDNEEIISHDLIDGVETRPVLQQSVLLRNEHAVDGLLKGVVEDYYAGGNSLSVLEGSVVSVLQNIFDLTVSDDKWIPDYDYDDDSNDEVPVNQISVQKLSTIDDDMDRSIQSLSNSILLFPKPTNIAAAELELQPLVVPTEVADNYSQELEAVQPGLTDMELAELGELEKAWEDVVIEEDGHDIGDAAINVNFEEQKAFWYRRLSEPEIDFQYLNKASAIQSQRQELSESRPEMERIQAHDVVVALQGNVKVKLYEGSEWTDETEISIDTPKRRLEKSSVEVHLRDILVQIFSYRLMDSADKSIPKERIDVMVKDAMLIYNSRNGKMRNKVLGAWKSSQRQWDDTKSIIKCTLLSYGDGNQHHNQASNKAEYRLYVALLPLRCFLTEEVIGFVKGLAQSQHLHEISTENSLSDSSLEVGNYFQTIVIEQTDLKIDYKASHVNVTSLQNGDYLQLLNIFPIDGLEVTLKSIRLNGISDIGAAGGHIVETWVMDIYKNQLHKVIAGAAPLKSIAHITSDVHSLIFAGNSKIGGNKKVVQHLQRGTKTLATTIAKEALDITHKLSMLVAQTITDFASDTGDQEQAKIPSSYKQPKNIGEGLNRAIGSVSREMSNAVETVIAVPIRQYERSGAGGVLQSVVRALPVAVLRPIAGVAEGVSYTILGFRNHLDPGMKRDEEDMWDVNTS